MKKLILKGFQEGKQREFVMHLRIMEDEGRFGFSVMGGEDEGFTPRVDEVAPGSPADRADLEVGDEIVEVNGQTLEDASHAQVISHIHQCIKSRTIQLRVRRSTSENIVPELNDIQDAYVIAVEDQARRRLEQLSALHKVQPVDITQIQPVDNGLGARQHTLANGDITPNSVYVATSDSYLHGRDKNANQPVVNGDKDDNNSVSEEEDINKNNGNTKDNIEAINCKCEDDQSTVEENSKEENNTVNTNTEGETKDSESTSECSDQESEEENNKKGDSMDSTAVMNGYMNNHGTGHMIPEPLDPRYHIGVHTPNGFREVKGGGYNNPNMDITPHRSREHLYEDIDDQNVYDNEVAVDDGPHREMAIDVPVGFIGSKKERPQYPSSSLTRPSPRSSLHNSPVKAYHPPTSGNEYSEAPKMTQQEEREHMERIKRYQEDLRKRREEENRIAMENEFLRTSLRGSKKLQSLEELRGETGKVSTPPSGIINPNFVEEEALNGDSSHGASRAATLPIRYPDYAARTPAGLEDLFGSLAHIQSRLRTIEDQQDVAFLNKLFQNSRFQNALSLHNKVIEVTMRQPILTPVCDNSQDVCKDVLNSIVNSSSANPHIDELRRLIQKPQFKNLLLAHDRIAAQKSEPANTSNEEDEREYLYERASQYNEDSIKIVRLQKTADPLGATIRNDGQYVMIGRIVKGGAAEKSGLLHEGDEILEINGIDIRGKSVNDVCDLMANMTGTLTFLIVPCEKLINDPVNTSDLARSDLVHVRAHYNYDPEDDLYIPCRELGISFQKGDILHIINQEDPNWWQAYREGEDDQTLAGLIPSKNFQQQREALRQTILNDAAKEANKKKSKCRCTRTNHKKKKKKQLYNGGGEEVDAEDILTYEEVSLYYPQPNRKRPIVLIGPPNVGRHEMRQRLMESDTERFAAAIPHTSRPRKDEEMNGADYHFVPRVVFEADIDGQKFVEYGEFEKNLYGTSVEAIRSVVNSGKICVLNLHPQSLRILKASDLKPYVVFVAPPNLEKLKNIRIKQGAKVSDEELKDIIEKAREMEDNYGHYFDVIITNFDLDKACEELVSEIDRLEVEPQWVPAHWVT